VVDSLTWDDREGGRWVIFEGELDHVACAQLEEQFRSAVADTTGTIVADLGGVSFVASHGLRMLLQIHKKLKDDGRQLCLTKMRPHVRQVFETTGLLQVIREMA